MHIEYSLKNGDIKDIYISFSLIQICSRFMLEHKYCCQIMLKSTEIPPEEASSRLRDDDTASAHKGQLLLSQT